MDKESSRGIGMRLLEVKTILSFLAPSHSGLGKVGAGKITPGKGTAVRRSCFLPHSTDIDINYYTHTHTHTCPPPIPRLRRSLLNRQPDRRVCGQRREWLRDRMAACWSWISSPVAKSCLWFMCFLLLRCFSCSHTVLPKEHSLGVIFFLLTFLMLCCIFLQFTVFLSCLPACHICLLCMYGQVDG